MVEAVIKRELLQAARQAHVVHALVEIKTKREFLQAARQAHVVPVLVEAITKRELLQANWQIHIFQTLVATKCEWLKIARETSIRANLQSSAAPQSRDKRRKHFNASQFLNKLIRQPVHERWAYTDMV